METAIAPHRRLPLRDVLISAAVGGFALGIVILLGLRLGAVPGRGSSLGSLQPDMPAPNFALPTPQGDVLRLSAMRGQAVWITFWASWCPPCRVEMPDAQAVFEASGPGRYRSVAINMQEDAATARAFLRGVGYTLPVALDTTGEVSLLYRVLSLPTHVFIDGEGVVREVYVGVLSRSQMAERAAALW